MANYRRKSNQLTTKQKQVKVLGNNLVGRTSSKRMAKDILVEQYGFTESTAKYAVGYRGY